MKFNYTVIIYTPQDLNHSSYIQTGLFELESLGLIKTKIKVDITRKLGRVSTKSNEVIISNHPQQKTSYYKLIDHSNQKEYFFATDLYDVSYFYSKYALENCDFIFKRNYISKYIGKLESKDREKIFPMGLTLGVQSANRKYWGILKMAQMISSLNLSVKIDRMFFKRILRVVKNTAQHRKYVTKGRKLDLLENRIESKSLSVFYQVRCFPRIKEKHIRVINNERSSLVRTLKNGLGDNFQGGLVPGKVANEYYNDCLTNLSTDPKSYLDHIKNAAICIYTNGLRDSPARKLSEYLSQGKCIVAQRFSTELPVSLQDGVNIRFFDSEEECILICKELLNNPNEVKRLSKNARAYFEKHVHPVQNVKRILELMLNKPLD